MSFAASLVWSHRLVRSDLQVEVDLQVIFFFNFLFHIFDLFVSRFVWRESKKVGLLSTHAHRGGVGLFGENPLSFLLFSGFVRFLSTLDTRANPADNNQDQKLGANDH